MVTRNQDMKTNARIVTLEKKKPIEVCPTQNANL